MGITITIEAANADELRQLMQDAASTLAGMRTEDIADARVSTVESSYQPAQPINTVTPQQAAQAYGASQAPVQTQVAQAPAAPAAPVCQPAAQQPAPVSQPAPAAPTAVPTAAPTYDFNQIATATMQLQQAGQNILELFAQFGIQSLNQLPKERYGEYVNVLRQRGAKI